MPSVSSLALDHQARLIQINQKATTRVLNLWRRMDFDALDTSWAALAPAIMQQSNAAQLAAAKTSDQYTSTLSREYGFAQESSRIIPESFVGVDGSGRSMESLLHGSVTTTKQAIGAGLSRQLSLEAGAAFLAAMMKTGLADLGRSADMVSATGKGYKRYVRVVNPGACSRCALLAGIGSYKTAFKRHPACKCTTAPVMDGSTQVPSGLYETPGDYFDSLSSAEQDRVFTKSGAEAIRLGADPVKVVSARRGANKVGDAGARGTLSAKTGPHRIQRTTIGRRPDGSPIQIYTTSEGTSVRGAFGRGNQQYGTQRLANDRYQTVKRIRVMPESIMELTDDSSMRQLLLRDAGYLDYPISNYSSNSWVAEHRVLRAQDRETAEAFYRSLGIRTV